MNLSLKVKNEDQGIYPLNCSLWNFISDNHFITERFPNFYGYIICLLAILKLMDIEAFGTSYKKYDLISSKFDGWLYIYPFCELLIGISFLNSSPPSLIIFIALILGISGMITKFKSVYLDKLKFNCECIGGYAKTPLGIISFIENLLMAIMNVLILIN